MLRALVSTALLLLVALAACAPADVQGTPLENDGLDAAPWGDDGGSGNALGGNCVVQRPPNVNPANLPSCCTDGAAHCVPSRYVPGPDTQALASCSGGYCVPDPFITDPGYLPPACTAFNGTAGACLSLCVPQVAQYRSILTQATCAATELCAPCVNPLTGKPSGACEFTAPGDCPDGVAPGGGGSGDGGATPPVCPYTGPPLLDPSTLPACGSGGGAHCLQAALVPPAMQAQLATCGGGFCVPDVFIESAGNFIPPTCASLDGAEGRCLDVDLPQVAAQASQLPQATCQSFERCAPCFSPVDGKSTGACSLSCDPGPTQPIVLFPGCCSEGGQDQGRCVPTSIIPASEQSSLAQKECPGGSGLCVPAEMLGATGTFQPPACTATGFLVGAYTGVCLSKCLSLGIKGLVLAQGTCDGEHTCAPCKDPITGQPTGAPGC